jgi:hypothetical protein
VSFSGTPTLSIIHDTVTFLSRRIEGSPNRFLPDGLHVSMSDKEFREWVSMARVFGIKNDDVTLVMLELA